MRSLVSAPDNVSIRRKIAPPAPPRNPGGGYYGASVALEFPIALLPLARLIVPDRLRFRCSMACDAVRSGKAPKLEALDRFMGPEFIGTEVDVAT